jgi:hypothetical protein
MKPAAVKNKEANFPSAKSCPNTTQIPADIGSSNRSNVNSPLIFFIHQNKFNQSLKLLMKN